MSHGFKRAGGDVVLEVTAVAGAAAAGVGLSASLRLERTGRAGVSVARPIFSLPGIFKTTLDTIPATVPYLRANAERVDRWGARGYAAARGSKLESNWHSERKALATGPRSMSLAEFEPLRAWRE